VFAASRAHHQDALRGHARTLSRASTTVKKRAPLIGSR
jgi:hypothetical protein